MVSQNPKGPIQENAHVPSPYHLLRPKGILFPLLFSTVAVRSQVLKAPLENGLLPKFTISVGWWGDPELDADSVLF